MSEAADDQPVVEDEPVLDAGVDQGADAQGDDQPELDEDGNPIEGQAEDDETEEIEYDGKKHALPKALAKEFREGTLRQADYTKKTQEVAQTRQALEARQAALVQQAEVQTQTLEDRATLKAIDAQLAAYQGLDWQQFTAQHGSDAAVAEMGRMRQLEAAKTQLNETITGKEADFRQQSERQRATALLDAEQVLSREIKGYGPDLIRSVVETANTFGFTPQELQETLIGPDGKADVRSFKLLAELKELRDFKAQRETKETKAKIAEKQASTTPARTVRANAGAYKPGLDDSLPPDEWLRRRNADLAKKRA